MTYLYECRNEKCKKLNIKVDIIKPMMMSDKEENCEECSKVMSRVFSSPAVKTNDGYKG